jgi:hypothetical protein
VEKMINRISAGEDDGGVIQNIDLLFSEFLYGHRFNLDKWPEINFDIEFLGQL